MNKLILLFLTILSINLYSSEWRTLESKHFKVHYEKRHEYIAEKTMIYLNGINDWMSVFLDYRPKMTNVVISDEVDDANGFARVVPYNLIHVYPYPPQADSVLGYYEDWLYILVLHEYLHIVHIDKKGKVPEFLNGIFGKLFAPNQVLPKFITEGLAVFFESLEGKGRLNSPFYKTLFRLSMMNNDISLSELSNVSEKYPYGGMVYLYGAFFIDYIFRYDEEFNSIAKFTENYGKNILPYGINRALKNSNGKTFASEYEKFKRYYKNRFKELYVKIKKEGITVYKTIFKGESYTLPLCGVNTKTKSNVSGILFKEGKLYFISSYPENIPYLYKYDPKTEKIEKIFKFTESNASFDILNGKVYYISFVKNKNRSERRLKSFDFKTESENIVIKELRVVDFKISPYGYDLALIVNENGIENIYIYNLKSKKLNKLTYFKELVAIGEINFINKNKIIFTINKDGKVWNLASLNLDNKEFEYLTYDDYFNVSPVYSEGKIYFISDRYRNILNLYELNLKTGEIIRKTNFFSGIIKIVPNEKKNEFYALMFKESGGFEVIKILEKDLISRKANSISINPPLFTPLKTNIEFTEKSFSVFPEILPKNIIPRISSDNFQSSIGVEISNNDVREYYFYSAYIDYYSKIDDFSFAFYFYDNSDYVFYSLGYSYMPVVSDFLKINGKKREFYADYHTFSFTASLPFSEYDSDSQFYLSVSDRYLSLPRFKYEFSPWDIPPRFPEETDKFIFSLGFSYSNLKSTYDTPGNSDGEKLNLRLSFRDKEIFASFNSINFSLLYKRFFPLEKIKAALGLKYYFSINFSELGISKQYLGGYPDYLDLFAKLIDRTVISGNYVRGYPSNVFSTLYSNLLSFEYRQHIMYLEKGYSTLPFYFHSLYLRFFYDLANIAEKKLYEANLKQGVGIEMTLIFYLGYFQPYNLSFGVSKGLSGGGINRFYLNFTSLF